MYEILSIRQFSICGAASVLEALDVGISVKGEVLMNEFNDRHVFLLY